MLNRKWRGNSNFHVKPNPEAIVFDSFMGIGIGYFISIAVIGPRKSASNKSDHYPCRNDFLRQQDIRTGFEDQSAFDDSSLKRAT